MEFERVLRTFVEYFDREGIRYAVLARFAGTGRPDVDLMIDLDKQLQTTAFAESIGFRTRHATRGYSTHVHKDTELPRVNLACLDPATAKNVFATARETFIDSGAKTSVKQVDSFPWDQYLAWCSYLTKDEPPSREITPPDAEPFTL